MKQQLTESRAELDAALSADVLIVDDDPDILALLRRWLEKAGYRVETMASAGESLSRMAVATPRVVITDYIMEEMDGISLLEEIQRQYPLLPVIMLSGKAEIPDAIRATQLGVCAFLTKPVKREELVEQIAGALQQAGHSADGAEDVFTKSIIYKSKVMADMIDRARMVATTSSPVFISGDTGSGKEVLARAIHDAGSRREQRFIGINCGAIPEQLLESELFGHEKGAFTGAASRHEGLFQAASGGTIFLDEVGDMPLGLQVKLLRVLQDMQVRPVGSTSAVKVDVRIISATHVDLDKSVEAGEFREDLYYRLNVLPLHMPALSERREDIAILAGHFLDQQAARSGRPRRPFAPDAMEWLVAAPWPGNVRQLGNVVEQCNVLSTGKLIPLSAVQDALRAQSSNMQTMEEARRIFERNYIIGVLRITNGNVANATRIAGRNRTDFYKLLNRHGINPSDFRTSDK